MPLGQVVMWLADLLVAKGAKRGVDRQKLATDAGVTDEDIARAIDGLLGPGWQRSTAIKSDRPLIHVMVWENTGRWHKRFYAIASYAGLQNHEGAPYRPLESVFSRH